MENNKTVKQFKRLLKFSGCFNITAASLFIFPKVYEYYLVFLNYINHITGLGGQDLIAATDPFHALFINTAGIDLVLIGTIVLLVSSNPLSRTNRLIILANGIGRLLFTIFVCYYAISGQLIGIFVVFGIIDFIITSAFIYYLFKTKSIATVN